MTTHQIIVSNMRLRLALAVVSIAGRNLETMAEVRQALNERRNIRCGYRQPYPDRTFSEVNQAECYR